jgi:hypothetical protein
MRDIPDPLNTNTIKENKQKQMTLRGRYDNANVVTSEKVIGSEQLFAQGAANTGNVPPKQNDTAPRKQKKSAAILPAQKGIVRDEELCRNICGFCKNVLSMRWAALCESHCRTGGRGYDACLTVWSFRAELGKSTNKP